VILYGESMLLSLMAANVNSNIHLHVVQTDSWEEVVSLAADQPPDVLFFDLASSSEGRVLTLLYGNPHLLLIGMDVESNRAILLTGQVTGSLTLDRVKEIVQGGSSVDSPT